MPDEFIPLAEQSGVIRPLTMWVFEHALAQWGQWHQEGLEVRLSLNLSVRVLQDKGLPQRVAALIERHGIDPGWVSLEVTESAVMSDPMTARRVLRQLADMGLKLSIDDFGTGHASLAYLKQLPVDEIKIDRSFVRDIPSDPDDVAITRAILALGHSLQMSIVAEGVESAEQLAFLTEEGCHEAQGSLVSEPLPEPEVRRLLQHGDATFFQSPVKEGIKSGSLN